MPFRIERNDIVFMKTDAIVNTANPAPLCGSGTDLAVYTAAGMDELLAARRKIGPIAAGDAALTPGFALPAKYIIHAVGPKWRGGTSGETEALRSCVVKALDLARDAGCESIAFPLLSTGNNGFPKDLALRTMLSGFSDWLMRDNNDMYITLTVFDRESADLSGKVSARLFGDRDGGLEEYIDDHYVGRRLGEEHPFGHHRLEINMSRRESAESEEMLQAAAGRRLEEARKLEEKLQAAAREREEYADSFGYMPEEETNAFGAFGSAPSAAPRPAAAKSPDAAPRPDAAKRPGAAPRPYAAPRPAASGPASGAASGPAPQMPTPPKPFAAARKKLSLAERILNIGDNFHKRLFRLIDARGMTHVQVYKAANLDKRLFSKILSNADYKPKKETALALSIALKLNIDETADLLSRAGFALSPSDMTDVIVRYYIETGNYDMDTINWELYKHGGTVLGSWSDDDFGASAG